MLAPVVVSLILIPTSSAGSPYIQLNASNCTSTITAPIGSASPFGTAIRTVHAITNYTSNYTINPSGLQAPHALQPATQAATPSPYALKPAESAALAKPIPVALKQVPSAALPFPNNGEIGSTPPNQNEPGVAIPAPQTLPIPVAESLPAPTKPAGYHVPVAGSHEVLHPSTTISHSIGAIIASIFGMKHKHPSSSKGGHPEVKQNSPLSSSPLFHSIGTIAASILGLQHKSQEGKVVSHLAFSQHGTAPLINGHEILPGGVHSMSNEHGSNLAAMVLSIGKLGEVATVGIGVASRSAQRVTLNVGGRTLAWGQLKPTEAGHKTPIPILLKSLPPGTSITIGGKIVGIGKASTLSNEMERAGVVQSLAGVLASGSGRMIEQAFLLPGTSASIGIETLSSGEKLLTINGQAVAPLIALSKNGAILFLGEASSQSGSAGHSLVGLVIQPASKHRRVNSAHGNVSSSRPPESVPTTAKLQSMAGSTFTTFKGMKDNRKKKPSIVSYKLPGHVVGGSSAMQNRRGSAILLLTLSFKELELLQPLQSDGLIAKSRSPLGFLNPWIYGGAYQILTDVTGGYSIGCNGSGCPAQAGKDAGTGCGTPNFDTPVRAAFTSSRLPYCKRCVSWREILLVDWSMKIRFYPLQEQKR